MNDLMLPPLIFTLSLDAESQLFFDGLRKEHFPPAINYLSAHLTLFHNLPQNQQDAMNSTINLISDFREFELEVTGLMSLGKGVAYKIESAELKSLRQSLVEIWKSWLIPQDKQGFRPHITIQNKVEPKLARVLLDKLAQEFRPFRCTATGVNCFEYLNGPWNLQKHIYFSKRTYPED